MAPRVSLEARSLCCLADGRYAGCGLPLIDSLAMVLEGVVYVMPFAKVVVKVIFIMGRMGGVVSPRGPCEPKDRKPPCPEETKHESRSRIHLLLRQAAVVLFWIASFRPFACMVHARVIKRVV